MSVDRGMDKDVVHVYNWILFSHKNEQNNAIFSNMDATKDYNTQWSKQTEKEKYHKLSLTCG